MNKKKIFIAIDTNNISKAKKIINDTQTNKIKVGYNVNCLREYLLIINYMEASYKV